MYRQHENPNDLESQLEELKAEYETECENGADVDRLISLSEDIHELEERINFAWQDDEYDNNY